MTDDTTSVSAPTPPLIAIVGRPNVGKSTLFNRIIGSRTSLVDDRPGVTRDRIFAETQRDERLYRFVDTGGFDTDPNDPLLTQMREQTQLAVDEADLVLVLLDSTEGVQAADREVVQMLRRSGKPIVAVVNKLDHETHADRLDEFYEIGLDLVGVSAEHGRGMPELWDEITGRLDAPLADEQLAQAGPVAVAEQEPTGDSQIEWDGKVIRVAVVGRPNVGKSSLINRLLGESRLVATEVPGTTRDPVDTELTVEMEHGPQLFRLVDTAGIRRKRSIADRLERFAVVAALRSIDRADVVLVVLDGTARPSDQDAKIAAIAHDRGKGVVLVANKWDLVENPEWREQFPKAVLLDLRFVSYAAQVRVSAKTGKSTHKLFAPILAAQRERHRRIGTGALNRFLAEVVGRHPPPLFKGKRAHLYFVSQPLVRPPTFIFTTRNRKAIPQAYDRYLRNQLREHFGFEGTPLWLKFRPRGKQKRGSKNP